MFRKANLTILEELKEKKYVNIFDSNTNNVSENEDLSTGDEEMSTEEQSSSKIEPVSYAEIYADEDFTMDPFPFRNQLR